MSEFILSDEFGDTIRFLSDDPFINLVIDTNGKNHYVNVDLDQAKQLVEFLNDKIKLAGK